MNNEIKSQDDLNAQGRETDVLIATLNKCQDIVRKNVELENDNKELKELLKECKTRMTDCLYKLYDEGGQSYPNLEEELKSLLTKIEEVLK